MAKWCIGDTHGSYKALQQVFERAPLKEGDTIIHLGDVADGWHEVYECVDFLLEMGKKYKMVFLKGNHDDWMLEWIQTGKHPDNWKQGGEGTLKSYTKKLGFGYGKIPLNGWDIEGNKGFRTGMHPMDIPDSHRDFWQNQTPYYKDEENNLFIHGGFNRHFLLSEQLDHTFWWDRDLWNEALSWESMSRGMLKEKPPFKIKEPVKEIFIGHTSTIFWKKTIPMNAANIWNCDTNAGWDGPLTILNVNTKEYFQSDGGDVLYPGMKER